MLYIILGLIVLGFLYWLITLIHEHLMKYGGIYIAIAILVAIYYFLGVDIFLFAIIIVVGISLIVFILSSIYKIIDNNKKKKIQLEKIRAQTSLEQRKHQNDIELKKELEKNCMYLGTMNLKRWKTQLSNYIDKEYSSSFDEIVINFSKQIEEQYILRAAEQWMKNFEEYIVQRPNGSPIHKMLEEVDCDALRMTHLTPTQKILEYFLKQGCKKISQDIPAKFKISDAGEYIFYQPTPYLQHLYRNAPLSIPDKKAEIIIDNDDDWGDI